MMRSNRGAARVSAVWIITVGVLFLAALVFAFISQSDLTREAGLREQADAEQAAAEASNEGLAEERRQVSRALGWYNRESADPSSNLEAVSAAIANLRSTYPDIQDSDKDFETILPKMTAAYAARQAQIDQLEARVQTLESELAAAKQATADVTSQKDSVIAGLQQQVADEQQNAAQRIQDLEQRLTTSQDQLSQRDNELRDTRAASLESERAHRREVQRMTTRVDELGKLTRFSREPFAELPDGEVLSVSASLPLAWVDLGAQDRIARGMRFEVRSARPGASAVKALAEVTRVEANRAEVHILDVADELDPVTVGDVIVNPLYDATGGRNAVLVGRFTGKYNEEDLVALLKRMGIHVQEDVGVTTHFLIVGSELYEDPETGDSLDIPLDPTDLPVFKEAQALGVQIIPIQDVRTYFDLVG